MLLSQAQDRTRPRFTRVTARACRNERMTKHFQRNPCSIKLYGKRNVGRPNRRWYQQCRVFERVLMSNFLFVQNKARTERAGRSYVSAEATTSRRQAIMKSRTSVGMYTALHTAQHMDCGLLGAPQGGWLPTFRSNRTLLTTYTTAWRHNPDHN